jgi:hypothetical protein
MSVLRYLHQPCQLAHMAIEFVVILQFDMLGEHPRGRNPDTRDTDRHPQQDRQQEAQP